MKEHNVLDFSGAGKGQDKLSAATCLQMALVAT